MIAEETRKPAKWWEAFCPGDDLSKMEHSNKLMLLHSILDECEEYGDKLLFFSQSLFTLDVIEHFLKAIDENARNSNSENERGKWTRNVDFFRIDGSKKAKARADCCEAFNNKENIKAR